MYMKKDNPLLPKVKKQSETTFYLLFFSINMNEQVKNAVYTKNGFIEVSDTDITPQTIKELEDRSGLYFTHLIFQASTIEIEDLSDDFINFFNEDNSKKNSLIGVLIDSCYYYLFPEYIGGAPKKFNVHIWISYQDPNLASK